MLTRHTQASTRGKSTLQIRTGAWKTRNKLPCGKGTRVWGLECAVYRGVLGALIAETANFFTTLV